MPTWLSSLFRLFNHSSSEQNQSDEETHSLLTAEQRERLRSASGSLHTSGSLNMEVDTPSTRSKAYEGALNHCVNGLKFVDNKLKPIRENISVSIFFNLIYAITSAMIGYLAFKDAVCSKQAVTHAMLNPFIDQEEIDQYLGTSSETCPQSIHVLSLFLLGSFFLTYFVSRTGATLSNRYEKEVVNMLDYALPQRSRSVSVGDITSFTHRNYGLLSAKNFSNLCAVMGQSSVPFAITALVAGSDALLKSVDAPFALRIMGDITTGVATFICFSAFQVKRIKNQTLYMLAKNEDGQALIDEHPWVHFLGMLTSAGYSARGFFSQMIFFTNTFHLSSDYAVPIALLTTPAAYLTSLPTRTEALIKFNRSALGFDAELKEIFDHLNIEYSQDGALVETIPTYQKALYQTFKMIALVGFPVLMQISNAQMWYSIFTTLNKVLDMGIENPTIAAGFAFGSFILALSKSFMDTGVYNGAKACASSRQLLNFLEAKRLLKDQQEAQKQEWDSQPSSSI